MISCRRYDERVGEKTDDFLVKQFGDSLKRETDADEAVWRSLPLFLAMLGLAVSALPTVFSGALKHTHDKKESPPAATVRPEFAMKFEPKPVGGHSRTKEEAINKARSKKPDRPMPQTVVEGASLSRLWRRSAKSAHQE